MINQKQKEYFKIIITLPPVYGQDQQGNQVLVFCERKVLVEHKPDSFGHMLSYSSYID